MTTAILSPPLTSTSGRAPVFSATIRFWIRVESLNRPPTLLTIPSSFSSSCMRALLELPFHDLFDPGHRRAQVVVDHLVIVLAGPLQFPPGRLEPPLDHLRRLRAAGLQPA